MISNWVDTCCEILESSIIDKNGTLLRCQNKKIVLLV